MSSTQALKAVARRFPLYRRAVKRFYAMKTGYCRGVHRSFGDALASIPKKSKVGYDHNCTTGLYRERLDETRPSDYAAIYWIGTLLEDVRFVLDLGGNLGWSYYAFQKHLTYPPELRWVICDVPAVVRAGKELADRRGAPHLTFTPSSDDGDGCDLLFTSGTLQYLDYELADLIATFRKRPTHVIVNRVPMTARPAYYTVQDIGVARCPYRIANVDQFIDSFSKNGYHLIDKWRCCESSCRISFRPWLTLPYYTGLYFRLSG